MAVNKQKIRNKKGFTLTELMVVIVVLGILLAMGISSFSSSRKRQALIRKSVELENLFKDARNASIIGLRGLDAIESVPPAFGIHIEFDSANDQEIITYFTDREEDYIYDDASTALVTDEAIGEPIILDDDVRITDLITDVDTESSILGTDVNIVFIPPRGLSLLTSGTADDLRVIDRLQIVLGVDGKKNVDSNMAVPINLSSGGGKVDLLIY